MKWKHDKYEACKVAEELFDKYRINQISYSAGDKGKALNAAHFVEFVIRHQEMDVTTQYQLRLSDDLSRIMS